MNARTNVRTSVWERTLPYALPILLLAGFAVRMIFVNATGFKVDVGTFEAWTISLVDHGLSSFYAKTGFADYPPGYFYILAVFGHVWALFRAHDPNLAILRVVVKLPAILADLGVGALIYVIGRRFAPPALALTAAAIYLLNPATILISADWGQVDSVAGGCALLAVYLLLRSGDEPVGKISWLIPAAWIALAYSLLVKPQAAVLIALFIAFAFTDRERARERVAATAIGILAAFVFAAALVIPFHPTANPIAALSWLYERYKFGSSVYDYNSVNAFNLWAIKGTLWQKDSTPIGWWGVQFPQYVWGIVLVLAALALVVWRYLQEKTPAALLESCAIGLLAFFILATRMHERYSFDAVMFCTACIPIARRYLWATLVLSVVLFANCIYSLQYINVVTNGAAGVNAQNLWGPLTSFYALVAVGTFFVLGYIFLGSAPEAERVPKPAGAAEEETPKRAKAYYDPREGLSVMTLVDYVTMSALGVVSFVLSIVRYWYPPTKIFDEIYFARAAEEYLRNMRIYENTHPPLTKLLVTLSVMLFGGLAHGDNSYGWRFLDVLFGAFVVMLLYAFAKRVTGSTVFSAIAAFLLICDGMHFVQSRIGTPEGFVVVFSLGAVYAFYRFWIASQVEARAHLLVPPWAFAVAGVVALIAGAVVVGVWDAIWNALRWHGHLDVASSIIVGLYVAVGVYLLLRYAMFRGWFADGATEYTFPEGSYALVDGPKRALVAPDGGRIEATGGKAKIVAGAVSQNRGGALVYPGDDYTITYRTDPSVVYETPEAAATYANNEIRTGEAREQGSAAKLWLITFTIALGLLVSSKWYGVMGFGVSFVVLICVWLQRYFTNGRPALWGNPRGFRLDGALATILFISATVYLLAWVPDLVRQSPDPNEIHNFNDVVYRQYTMFMYHDTLKAKHPYSSFWWEWPIDAIPIAYYYQDNRQNKNDPNGFGVEEITSMPNPINMWIGLICVPVVGVLAWLRKNKGYALIVLTYLLQWLPWMKSPRITFAYHFYVDIPLICLCNAIVLQQIWLRVKDRRDFTRFWGIGAIAATVAVIAAAFVFFYPILAAVPLTWNAWHLRMWFPWWIVGPYG
ncbi:MAG TPA: phospholipid carrier-dependent glycosyltransferase [Candidatus Baltobacteraceae bacterium]|nr:phospholipid carrier-dependent glycosyltransferase [Candidatus Baltobacteraceae bacterium]